MLNRIVLAGGSGYLGRVLARYFSGKAKEIIILSRKKASVPIANCRTMIWDAATRGDWEKALDSASLVVNLCGKNVNCRYSTRNKAEIFRSRLEPTALLGKAIAEATNPPQCWINIASATIYRHAEDRPQDEQDGELGTGFSVEVCQAWEETFWQAETPATRKAVLRVGLVLGREDGVFPRLKRLTTSGLGGHQGNGQQMVSWIHEQDFARVVDWIFAHGKTGVYNCTAPEAVTNRTLMKMFRKSMGIPVGMVTPQWLLEIGARIIGTETELVLKSRWVQPKRLLDEGFQFQFALAEHAVHEILSARV
ncbi:MAG TPA: TIGR01777 family oxidoreductase [Flavisolibacter sp.]|jgi:hypothetical protein|nr:TIGR01777 family oxidoreductase [Flavisolibacter sp.]